MRLTSSILIKSQEIAAKNREVNAQARDHVEEANVRCQSKALELGNYAGNQEAAADQEKGISQSTTTAMFAIGGVMLAIVPGLGVAIICVAAAILIAQAMRDREKRVAINAIKKEEGEQKLCGEQMTAMAKRFDDRAKAEAEDMKVYIQRLFDHTRRDFDGAHNKE